jgi:LacI family transcriptional regulator
VDRPLPERVSDTVLVDTRRAAQQATEHLLAQGYTRVGCITGPTGVRTADDRLAGYRDALRGAKVRSSSRLVRRTEYKAAGAERACVGVVAFDEVPWAELVDPPLTVVAQPAYEIGSVAAQLLLARIADNNRAPTTTTLGARLIDRGSSHRP